MRRAPVLRGELLGLDHLQEPISKTSQVFLAIEVVKDLRPRGMPDPVQPANGIAILSAHHFLKKENPGDEILQRTRVIKETSLSGYDDLRDPGDRGREHDPAPGHRLHQHQWNSL